MTKEQITDAELDALLGKPEMVVDDGFSDAVLAKMDKRAKIALVIPFAFGLIGAFITYLMAPTGWFADLFGESGLSGVTLDKGFIGEMSILPLIAVAFLALWALFTAFMVKD